MTEWFHKLGRGFAKLVIRVPIFTGLLLFLVWAIGDHLPQPIIWFIAGAMFNDFWNETS